MLLFFHFYFEVRITKGIPFLSLQKSAKNYFFYADYLLPVEITIRSQSFQLKYKLLPS